MSRHTIPNIPDSLEERDTDTPESVWPGDHTRDLWDAILSPHTDGAS